jgi:hypothetical protein
MDLGNSRDTAQVALSAIGKIKQPEFKKYRTIEEPSFITEMFKTNWNKTTNLMTHQVVP